MELKRINGVSEDYHTSHLEQRIEAFEIGVASILQELILRYTCGDSSSVKVETALNILKSIYYAIDACVTSLDDDIAIVHKMSVEEVYASGLEVLKSCVEESKQLYGEIARDKLNLPLGIYNDTIDEALPAFFRAYDVVFAAHDTTSSMDYPLVFDDMAIEGIFYIRRYLETLKLETQFCNCFKQRSILKFLRGYGNKYRFDYINAPLNLFEILFDQSIFAVLSGNEVGLIISEVDIEHISMDFLGNTEQEIHTLIDEAVKKIILKFDLGDQVLIDYMNRYKELFVSRFMSALKNRNLSNMVVIDGVNPYDGKIVFRDGDRMSDEGFTHLIDLLQQCEDVKEKIQIISQHVHSLEDYMDLLAADCLYDDELVKIMEILDDAELAVLGTKIFYEELRCDLFRLSPKNISAYKKNTDAEWQVCYIDFIFQLGQDRRKRIENLINQIVTITEDLG